MDILDQLESEALYIIRKGFLNFRKMAVLFSGGKDSSVLLHLICKALQSKDFAYDILNIDTGYNFEEMNVFCQKSAKSVKKNLIVGSVQSIKNNYPDFSENRLQSYVLKNLIATHGYQCIFAGGRRDEDKARSKESFFSKRDAFGAWNPELHQAEIWPHLKLQISEKEHYRSFPISNWTERDIWAYILREQIEVCSLYYAHNIDGRDGLFRYRTVGDKLTSMPIVSSANNNTEILNEIISEKTSERARRQDDHFSEFAMEIRKKEGYF